VSADVTAVEVVAVGDELLEGVHPDLNSPWIGARLAEYGRRLRGVQVVSDDEPDIERAVRAAAARAPLVIVTGGLGPTLDDVTRHGVARAAGLALEESAVALANVRAWYERAGREMPAANLRQALTPVGGTVIRNDFGTAPGFRCAVGAAQVLVLPGPPRELHGVWQAEVHPWLQAHPVSADAVAVRRLHFSDIPESKFAEVVGAWMDRAASPLLGCTVKGGVLTARILGRAPTGAAAEALAEARAAELAALFPGRLLGRGDEGRVAALLGAELLARGLTVTVAESCTGGLVAAELTSVAGISAALREAFVTYADAAKVARLGVPPGLIAEHGAVSAPVAAAMARGALAAAGADLALAISGVAGPGGGSAEKPVGLVWFGVARRAGLEGAGLAGADCEVWTVERRWPPAPRAQIRDWAAQKGLALLLEVARGGAPG